LIVIDTSVAVSFLRGDRSAVATLQSTAASTDALGISSVSLFELLGPLRHRKLEAQERTLRAFVSRLRLLPLDADSAEVAAQIMGSLLRTGRELNAMDVMIAGTALAAGAEKIVTRDRDFQRIAEVSDLRVDII
jgi:tRNA(fMet)-specific endonuclease VapC